ncbi:hypothetical protein [Streptomyces iranensis]|uniref:Transcriptional regulator n=1 Tax=Streptomyces iranensis TaxID=576784 RepID=A0A061ACK5_9ACTN|nr:hypothetical protein [Streptomyces iranensis]MBP2067597.1 hypothetical protein [Streptomyces iranensis]CDR18151.1 predicted protein [Streptomyces iranensis]
MRRPSLTTTKGGPQVLADAGIRATPATIRAWTRGTQRPRPANLEAIDTAYWNLRAHNVLTSPGALKQHLNRNGRSTRIEIHPVNQTAVDEPRRRDNLRIQHRQIRYIWDDALVASDLDTMEDLWDDIIAELDSDWGAYTCASYIGIGA